MSSGDARKHELLAGPIPRSGRRNELQALDVRAGRGVGDLAQHLRRSSRRRRYRSIENRSRSEKKITFEPSGLSSGLTFISPSRRFVITGRATAPGIFVASAIGTVGLEHRVVPLLRELLRVDLQHALERRVVAAARRAAGPQHVADHLVAVPCRRCTPTAPGRSDTGNSAGRRARRSSGSFSRRAASRIHIAVCGSTGPIDRYSAIPSMNHSGSVSAPPLPELTLVLVMSYWNAWTSSWPSTWSVASIGPASGRTIRRLYASVTPPVPSPISPSIALVCRKCGRAGVEDQRLAAAQLVVQQLREPRVPALGHPRGHPRRGFLLRVEVDVEMFGLQDLEVELPVLHLVPAEIARPGRAGPERRRRAETQSKRVERRAEGTMLLDARIFAHARPVVQRMYRVHF